MKAENKSNMKPPRVLREMDIEAAYQSIGEYGRYHRRKFWMMSVIWVYLGLHQIHNVYLAAESQFVCVKGDGEHAGCPAAGEHCDRFKFSQEFTSIVSEWGLVCNRGYMATAVQSYFMSGVLIGTLMLGYIADRYGRRHMIWTTCVLSGLSSFAGGYATEYWFYCAMRGLCGFFIGGLGLVGFVLLTELMPSGQNRFVGLVLPCIYAGGIPIFSIMAYNLTDWRLLTLTTSVPGIMGIIYLWVVPESPRWLFSRGRLTEAERVLYAMFRGNNQTAMSPEFKIGQITPSGTPRHVGATSLFTNGVLLKRTCVNLPCWFMFSAIYYGMTISAGSLGSNRFISISLSGLVEIPANLLGLVILDRLGRRVTIGGCMLLSGVPCIAILLLPQNATLLIMCLGLTGKMAVSLAFSVAYIFVAELYPTVVRNNALALCYTAAMLGSIAAPLITPLGKIYPTLDYLVYGAMSLLSALLLFQLPDTTGQSMPETLEDLYMKTPAR